MLISGVMLLYEIALLHTAARTRALLGQFDQNFFYHTPYIPDITQSYYKIFFYLEN
jgi:hypothetical protein